MAKGKQPNKWERSDDYRALFLRQNKGIFGKFYICVYCGKLISVRNMQVDHHIAINYVKNNPFLKIYFGLGNLVSNLFGSLFYGKKWKKNKGVNVTYNLLPACVRCNGKKKDKGGLWIIRGMIGGFIWKTINLLNKFFSFLFATPIGPILCLAGLLLTLFYTPLGSFLLSILQ